MESYLANIYPISIRAQFSFSDAVQENLVRQFCY